MTPANRDALDVDALRTDRYIEALLAGGDARTGVAPVGVEIDPDVRLAADELAQELVRVHPSFRFEERLAARLADAARSTRLAPAAGGEVVLPFRVPLADVPGLAPFPGGVGLDPRELRPLLIRGALTSAALSLAGAAWVAWRRTQPPRSPMARAVRAARENRLARRLS